MVPYDTFIERDDGPLGYFAVPLGRVEQIFSSAHRGVSELCHTVRGPSM